MTRKLSGWTVGIICLPLLVVLRLVCWQEEQRKGCDQIAYAIGLTDTWVE